MVRDFAWFFLVAGAALAGTVTDAAGGSQNLTDAVKWLEGESHRLIRASRRTMKDDTAAFPPQVGIGYEAFWLRDFVYTLEGSIDAYSDKELLDAARLFIRSLRADGAGVDCVGFDGRPIYQPGYGSMGANPVADFRTGGACEWILGDKRQLPNYLASACLPLAGIRAMIDHRH